MKKAFTFTIIIPNPIYKWVWKWRTKRACTKWNLDLPDKMKKCRYPSESWKWSALVWQEIWMWINLADPYLPPKEIDELSHRRGFTPEQKDYLIDMMKHVYLWKVPKI